jgi:hypothetical protein
MTDAAVLVGAIAALLTAVTAVLRALKDWRQPSDDD